MLVVRYFVFVGVALLALLFAADAYLPKLPPAEVPKATADLSSIRIHSDQKWPERVVFDTTLPTITHPPTPMRVVTIPPATEGSEKARLREALAQAQPADLKKHEPRRRHRTIARVYSGQQPIRLAQQPRFGFYGNGFFGNSIW
jgi:hypothetical protein